MVKDSVVDLEIPRILMMLLYAFFFLAFLKCIFICNLFGEKVSILIETQIFQETHSKKFIPLHLNEFSRD